MLHLPFWQGLWAVPWASGPCATRPEWFLHCVMHRPHGFAQIHHGVCVLGILVPSAVSGVEEACLGGTQVQGVKK